MKFVTRFVKKITDDSLDNDPVQLETLRSVPAWVLLGEPGAGKSKVFEMEAKANNGLHLSITEFISVEIEDEWKNHCLFLDGLDEARASSTNQTILYQVRSRLKRLGFPAFRIACRAADWHGLSDQDEIIGASPDGQLGIYTLTPLKEVDIKYLLAENFNRTDSEELIAQAQKQGISALLSNPQTLQLTVKALEGTSWPNNREEAYQLGCNTFVQEGNKKHRDRNRFQQVSQEDLINSAGFLFAILLLGDKSGIALDPTAQNELFIELSALQINSNNHDSSVLDTTLFVPASSNEERLEPIHRSVAEYLAAQWLGDQIDKHGLPIQRVLNLILGFDGKAVTNLRGLYGWLALKSLKARQWLIKNDPLTVLLCSDLYPMDVNSKKQILQELQIQIQNNPSIIWDVRDYRDLAPLFQPELKNEYLITLQNTNRDDATQTYLVFILKILKLSASKAKLNTELKNIAADGSRWERVRKLALEAWLISGITTSEIIEFLDGLNERKVPNANEELIGVLLNELFPKSLTSVDVLPYLQIPQRHFMGTYQHFWVYDFPKKVPIAELPILLNQLSKRSDLQLINWKNFHLSRMLTSLIARGVEAHGDKISNLELFTWLHLGTDEYGGRLHEPEFRKQITEWLKIRPERYKGLLGICYDRNEDNPEPLNAIFNDSQVLQGIPAPSDIGLWHFQQISLTKNQVIAKEHLAKATRTLWSNQSGLTIEMLFAIVTNDSVRRGWLKTLLVCELSEGYKAQIYSNQNRQIEQVELKKKRCEELSLKISEIRQGMAQPAQMNALANVWQNRYSDTRGDTPLDRFKNYCDNYEEVFKATKEGMQSCLLRKDIPTVDDIIKLFLRQESYLIREACLLGIEILWTENPSNIELIDSTTLEKVVCFYLTNGSETTEDWFLYLLKTKPELVAKIFITYSIASFKAKKDYINGLHALEEDAAYLPLARLCLPALLRGFPTRNKTSQLAQLRSLLRAALKYSIPELLGIIEHKVKLKSLDSNQRVYFLLTGTFIDPVEYEKKLWDFVGHSWQRIEHLSDFIGNNFGVLPIDLTMSSFTLGKLIEIQTPFAEFDWPVGGGFVSQAMNLGDHIRSLIGKLTAIGTTESLEEINRLLELPSLGKIKRHLLISKQDLLQRLRENSFSHPKVTDVVKILRNQSPVNPSDLQAIVMNTLDQIATEIRTSNSDIYRQFWTEGKVNKHKTENSCRDALLTLLRNHLTQMGIECQPEVDYVNDKRADIRVSYQNQYYLPIEIKGEWHSELWSSAQTQLIPLYTTPRETQGYGVYLILWVGGTEQPAARDDGRKASTPTELESRLHQHITRDCQNYVSVKVLDISWPKSVKNTLELSFNS